jgi:outer membrane protein insertion porin family
LTPTRFRILILFVLAISAVARAQEQTIVDAIEFRGLSRISEQLIQSQLEVKVGDALQPRAVSRDIRRLYEMGFFVTVKVELDTSSGRNVAVYSFVEERIIDQIQIIGNKKIKDRQLRSILTWSEGESFFAEGYEEERDALIGHYRSKGFLSATADIIVEESGPARVRITYLIHEGRKAKIRSVRFNNNDALSNRKLRKVVKTGKGFLFLGGRFNDEKFESDIKNIVDKYGEIGRLEARVSETDFAYSKNGKKLDISIFVQEGPEYTVSNMDVAENYVFTDMELNKQLHVGQGDVHNKKVVGEDSDRVRSTYQDNGYLRARVAPVVTLDRENHTTNIIHQVREGDLKYIREVKIAGNSVTQDEIIRRWILLNPGDRYDGSLYRASQNRLERSQYFSGVRTSIEDVPGNDKFVDLLYDVDEGKTGNFNFGGGFNTATGVGGFGELRLNNFDITNWPSFSGGGQQFSTRMNIGTQRTNFNVSFTDPEIFGYPFSFGVDLFNDTFRSRGGSTFTQETRGGQIRLAKSLSNNMTARTSLRLTDVTITNLATFVDPRFRELDTPGATFSNTWGINRNTLNHFRDPTKGSLHDLSLEIAGLGGDNEFLKLQHDSTFVYGFKRFEKWSVSYRTREGVSKTYGSSSLVPLVDRFYAGGGTTIRGYDTRDVGPRAKTFTIVNGQLFVDEQSIGGEFRLLNTAEAKYKFNDTIRLYTFADGGGVWLEPSDFDPGDIKYSVGLGVGIQVPFLGPLRLDYGVPLNPESNQGNGRIHLQTSLRF